MFFDDDFIFSSCRACLCIMWSDFLKFYSSFFDQRSEQIKRHTRFITNLLSDLIQMIDKVTRPITRHMYFQSLFTIDPMHFVGYPIGQLKEFIFVFFIFSFNEKRYFLIP